MWTTKNAAIKNVHLKSILIIQCFRMLIKSTIIDTQLKLISTSFHQFWFLDMKKKRSKKSQPSKCFPVDSALDSKHVIEIAIDWSFNINLTIIIRTKKNQITTIAAGFFFFSSFIHMFKSKHDAWLKFLNYECVENYLRLQNTEKNSFSTY